MVDISVGTKTRPRATDGRHLIRRRSADGKTPLISSYAGELPARLQRPGPRHPALLSAIPARRNWMFCSCVPWNPRKLPDRHRRTSYWDVDQAPIADGEKRTRNEPSIEEESKPTGGGGRARRNKRTSMFQCLNIECCAEIGDASLG